MTIKPLPIYSLVLVIFLAGCSVKDNNISLGEYKSGYYPQKQDIKTVTVGNFSDDRREKPLLAVIKGADKETIQTVFSQDDLGTWLKDAYAKELKSSSEQVGGTDIINVSAKITDLSVEYIRNPTMTKNLSLYLKVEMTLKLKDKTLKKEYYIREQNYLSFLTKSEELTPFVKKALSNIVASMSKDTIQWSKDNQ